MGELQREWALTKNDGDHVCAWQLLGQFQTVYLPIFKFNFNVYQNIADMLMKNPKKKSTKIKVLISAMACM